MVKVGGGSEGMVERGEEDIVAGGVGGGIVSGGILSID